MAYKLHWSLLKCHFDVVGLDRAWAFTFLTAVRQCCWSMEHALTGMALEHWLWMNIFVIDFYPFKNFFTFNIISVDFSISVHIWTYKNPFSIDFKIAVPPFASVKDPLGCHTGMGTEASETLQDTRAKAFYSLVSVTLSHLTCGAV